MKKLSRNWRTRQGKAFEAEFRESLKHTAHSIPLFWQRLYDYRDYLVVHKNIKVPHQPADFYAVAWGHFFLLECKSTHIDRVRYDTLKEHQMEAHLNVVNAGGTSWILLSSRTYPESPNKCWAISIDGWIGLETRCKAEKRKTFTLKELAERSIELKRQNGFWLLKPLFIRVRI